MRISFVGGGTDLKEFYTRYPGRVISVAIDKYAYATINRPLVKTVSVRYVTSELVNHPKELKHNRVREALLHFGIHNNIDVATFSRRAGKDGFGFFFQFFGGAYEGSFAFTGKEDGAGRNSRVGIASGN